MEGFNVDLQRMQLSSLRFPVSNRKVEVRNWVILKRNFARILREDFMEPLAIVRRLAVGIVLRWVVQGGMAQGARFLGQCSLAGQVHSGTLNSYA